MVVSEVVVVPEAAIRRMMRQWEPPPVGEAAAVEWRFSGG